MKSYLNLKRSVLLAIVCVVLTLVIGYSILAASYFIAGMDNIVAANMARAMRNEVQPELSDNPFKQINLTKIWAEQPASVRVYLPQGPVQPDKLYKTHLNGKKRILFALKQKIDNEIWYSSFHMSPRSMAHLVGVNVRQNMNRLLFIALGITLAISLIIWWFLRRIQNPISRLNRWAQALNEHNLNEPIPDFIYPELNGFAHLVHGSLYSAKAGIEREQQLLRQTSHELRTPISVIRSNVELAKKIQLKSNSKDVDEQILQRIDRASLAMKQMTETLLWLNKDELKSLDKTRLRMDALIEDIMEPLRYLLLGKPVTVAVSLNPVQLDVPEAATRIVLGNLIRNAFQHTVEGHVEITLIDNIVVITNRESTPEEAKTDLGFGLGLKLTGQLTQKLGWGCITTSQDAKYTVELTIN